ncbi:DNA alkylation repair protein [bacterium]|nr:DNA alkylation repair protein [bacterium]
MSKNQTIQKIREELKANIDLEYKKSVQRFFKEHVKIYGVRTPVVRQISKKYFAQVKDLDKNKIFDLCEEFLKSGYGAEAIIAFDWAFRIKTQYKKSDFKIFESWLKKYVDNWGKCDDFCTHAFGEFLVQCTEFLPRLNAWTASKNRWLRRASAVILIYPIKQNKKFLKNIFKIADILLQDQDDLVQKGYGWLLKETSNLYQKQVFDYVMSRKNKMPRTALRYAIEKMPAKMKKQAMAK